MIKTFVVPSIYTPKKYPSPVADVRRKNVEKGERKNEHLHHRLNPLHLRLRSAELQRVLLHSSKHRATQYGLYADPDVPDIRILDDRAWRDGL